LRAALEARELRTIDAEPLSKPAPSVAHHPESCCSTSVFRMSMGRGHYLARKWTDVPVIVMSVRDREEEKIRVLDAGADDYLTKPLRVGELLPEFAWPCDGGTRPEVAHQPLFKVGDLEVDSRGASSRKAVIRST